MTFHFNSERMIPTVFYGYPTCVCARIGELEDFVD